MLQIGSSSEGSCVLNPSIVACGKGQSAVINRRGELHAWGLPLQGIQCPTLEIFQSASAPAQILLQNGVRVVGICQGTGHTLVISEVHFSALTVATHELHLLQAVGMCCVNFCFPANDHLTCVGTKYRILCKSRNCLLWIDCSCCYISHQRQVCPEKADK